MPPDARDDAESPPEAGRETQGWSDPFAERPEERGARERELADSMSLIEGFRAGRVSDLDTLFKRYYARVLRYVRCRMGELIRSRTEAEDIVQDTFVAAMLRIDSVVVSEPGQLIHWLATIAENQIRGNVDYLRAEKRNPLYEVSIDCVRASSSQDPGAFEPAVSATSPLDVLGKQEQLEVVDGAITTLPPDYRDVLLLRNIAGASWKYVGETMGERSEGAAIMLHSRAVVALLKRLGPQDEP